MGYPKNGYDVPTVRTSLDDELYALVKRLKRMSSTKASTLLDRANKLIAAGADLDQTGRPRGPLLAVILGPYMTDEREAMFRTLLEQGANPNAPVSGLSTFIADQPVRYTSLAQVAVSERMSPVICGRLMKLLAKYGADLNTRTRNGWTALDIATCRLWDWEQQFDLQRTAGADGPYSCEGVGFMLLAHMPPCLRLVEIVVELGGRPSLWTETQVQNCRERLGRIYENCFEARQKISIKAEISGMESEHYFSFARMDVGEPTPPPVWHTRGRSNFSAPHRAQGVPFRIR